MTTEKLSDKSDKDIQLETMEINNAQITLVGVRHFFDEHFQKMVPFFDQQIEQNDVVLLEATPNKDGFYSPQHANDIIKAIYNIIQKNEPVYSSEHITNNEDDLLLHTFIKYLQREGAFTDGRLTEQEIQELCLDTNKQVAFYSQLEQIANGHKKSVVGLEIINWSKIAQVKELDIKRQAEKAKLTIALASTPLAYIILDNIIKKITTKNWPTQQTPTKQINNPSNFTRRKLLLLSPTILSAMLLVSTSLDAYALFPGKARRGKNPLEIFRFNLQDMRDVMIAKTINQLTAKKYTKILTIYGQEHLPAIQHYLNHPLECQIKLWHYRKIYSDVLNHYLHDEITLPDNRMVTK